MRTSYSFFVLCLLTLISTTGCLGGGGGSESSPSASSDTSSASQIPFLASQCGSVINNNLVNPAPSAERVNVEAMSSDTVVITRLEGDQAGNTQLVKLHGVTSDGILPFLKDQGAQLINRFGLGAYFVSAGEGCEIVVDGGGFGVLGQIFTSSGDSISEMLLAQGAVAPTRDFCGGDVLEACYGERTVEVFSSAVIRDFLWKPASERDGNLVVLVDPFDVTVRIEGAISETLTDFGYSNGRGTTARANRPGCAYGNSVRVRFFDRLGLTVRTASGATSITVPSGCSRSEQRF